MAAPARPVRVKIGSRGSRVKSKGEECECTAESYYARRESSGENEPFFRRRGVCVKIESRGSRVKSKLEE